MNANVSKSDSLYGKMTAIFGVALLSFSGFSLMGSAGSNDEQEDETTSGITLGEALVYTSDGA